MSAAARRTGKVKFFNSQKGFGFIIPSEHSDVSPASEIFVHHTAIHNDGGFKSLGEVEFDLVQGPKGMQASNVTGPHGTPVRGDPNQGRGGFGGTPFRDNGGRYGGGGGYGGFGGPNAPRGYTGMSNMPYGGQQGYGQGYGHQHQHQQHGYGGGAGFQQGNNQFQYGAGYGHGQGQGQQGENQSGQPASFGHQQHHGLPTQTGGWNESGSGTGGGSQH
ncbi:Y box binding protein 1 [Mortierella polycephala]|uniref:Y box binding protein 1 n=1 Tax=Mortierella polycephala TaxID=41804 RepID=A0A9P6Q661_9FUNG|nr:Y box binding protein 1 [Mortierella polycephala]